MLARTLRAAAAVAAVSVALIGTVLFPALVLLWALGAAAIGGIVAAGWHLLRPEAGNAARVGAATAAVTTALGLTVSGSIVLGRVAPVWVVPLLLGLGGLLGWRRRRSWITALQTLVGAAPTAAPRSSAPAVGRAARGHSGKDERGPRRAESLGSVPAMLAQLPSLNPGAISTLQLCGAWQRSYWLLLDLPPGPACEQVVSIRHHVLDELERRDPTGFGRWLKSGPRAGSHPGQFLVADS